MQEFICPECDADIEEEYPSDGQAIKCERCRTELLFAFDSDADEFVLEYAS